MDNLTNDAKYLLSRMYKEYLSRRKSGMPKQDAIYFQSTEWIHDNLMSEWSLDDTEFTCKELRNAELISAMVVDGYVFVRIQLTTKALSKMEDRFKDRIDLVLDYASKIKNLIPFI